MTRLTNTVNRIANDFQKDGPEALRKISKQKWVQLYKKLKRVKRKKVRQAAHHLLTNDLSMEEYMVAQDRADEFGEKLIGELFNDFLTDGIDCLESKSTQQLIEYYQAFTAITFGSVRADLTEKFGPSFENLSLEYIKQKLIEEHIFVQAGFTPSTNGELGVADPDESKLDGGTL